MIIAALQLTEPKSRNLDEEERLRDLHRINYYLHSLAEDLLDLLPGEWEVKVSEAQYE